MSDETISASDYEYLVDPQRTAFPETGIFVRAKWPTGKWEATDVVKLDRASLLRWLRSRGERSALAEGTVLHLLGHHDS